MSSTTKNISNTTSTIPKFLVGLGKMGVENGKMYTQMKKNNKLLKKNQQKAYKALLKEVQTAEKEAAKNKKMARKVLPGVLRRHSKNIKNIQKAEKLKKRAIKVINVVLKKHSKNIKDNKGAQNSKKKVGFITEPVVEPVAAAAAVSPVIEQPATVTDKYPRMTNTVGTANKFWKIIVNGTETCVTYGKVGTEGKSSKVKDHGFENKAHAFAVKQVEIKSKGGYIATQDQ